MAENYRRRFYQHFSEAMDDGAAAIFAGAGLSMPAGFVNWKELLREVASDLGLDVDREADLIAVAQYHFNTEATRAHLNRVLLKEFTKRTRLTENHRLLAELPIQTVWTTNYDNLLERAYESVGKRVDVKSDPAHLTQRLPQRNVTLYKMHGDSGRPDQAVLIKDDYETFGVTRGGFVHALNADLQAKTFLFLGYSFSDPDVDYILGRLRVANPAAVGDHYWVVRRIPRPNIRRLVGRTKADHEYEIRKQQLRVSDLKRYGIKPLWIDDYTEVTDILRNLRLLDQRRSVFVSGSAYDLGPMGRRLEDFARALGTRIIQSGHRLVSGYGLGIGGAVLIGVLEALHGDERHRLEDRTILRPFPQSGTDSTELARVWRRYREEMLSHARFAVFLAGNKIDGATGRVVPADGVREEFRIARAKGVFVLPIGATGWMARELWMEVIEQPQRYFPGIDVAAPLKALGNSEISNEALLNALFTIIERTTEGMLRQVVTLEPEEDSRNGLLDF